MNLNQLIEDHEKYELFDLTDEQREKLKGEYVPGCKATIYWHFKDDGHNFKLKDSGYCFDLPGMAGDFWKARHQLSGIIAKACVQRSPRKSKERIPAF